MLIYNTQNIIPAGTVMNANINSQEISWQTKWQFWQQ